MTVDLLPETMRFVSIGEDRRLDLEFTFEVTSGLTRFTLPVTVNGISSIDEALVEATAKVRSLGAALARAAGTPCWAEPPRAPMTLSGCVAPVMPAARPTSPPFRLPHGGARALITSEATPSPQTQCCDAILDVA